MKNRIKSVARKPIRRSYLIASLKVPLKGNVATFVDALVEVATANGTTLLAACGRLSSKGCYNYGLTIEGPKLLQLEQTITDIMVALQPGRYSIVSEDFTKQTNWSGFEDFRDL